MDKHLSKQTSIDTQIIREAKSGGVQQKAASLISRSRNYSSKLLKKLLQEDILKWYGSNKNDSNQYYLLNIPNN